MTCGPCSAAQALCSAHTSKLDVMEKVHSPHRHASATRGMGPKSFGTFFTLVRPRRGGGTMSWVG